MKAKKRQHIFMMAIFTIVGSLLISGCGKSSSGGSSGAGTSSIEKPNTPTGRVSAIKLGQSEQFSILAYASITSIPNSSIAGKVGLMPGMREQIILNPSEVAGGAADIVDSDSETLPINLLSNAKVDMVSTYNATTGMTADSGKAGIYNGVIDEKILTPGVYEWTNNVTISKDFTLQGSATDLFIFKIKGHLKIGKGVQMLLGEGVRPENILWQVAGSAVLEPQSQMYGTIIAQPSIELKSHSVLTGRAFCKNGYVNLDQATIKKP